MEYNKRAYYQEAMSQPSFSYHFESTSALEEVWALLTDLNFWRQSWQNLCLHLTLSEPIRLGSRGSITLREGESWEVLITDFRPARELTFQLKSPEGRISLNYQLLQHEKLVVSCTVRLEHYAGDTQNIVSSLINPVITKHLNQFHTVLTSQPSTTVTTAKPQAIQTVSNEFLSSLDVQAGFRLWQLANLWQSKIRSVLKPYQLSPTQWLLLYALVRLEKHPDPITPSTLSSILELNTMLVSDVINALVKKHLVHKIKILPDRRSFVISATAEGRITAVEAHTAIIQTDKKFFSPEPLASIYKLLLPHKV